MSMLECHACFRRCLGALIPLPVRLSQNLIRPRITPRKQVAGIRTSRVALVYQSSTDVVQSQNDVSTPGKFAGNARRGHQQIRSDEKGRQRVDSAETATKGKEFATSGRLALRNLNMELKYLRDPLALADHIKHVLDSKDEDKAIALVRLSSKANANTVSWNHLIDYQMKCGKTKVALDTYNDMKKRGQRPDQHTYTILLRGLANFAHHPGSLGRALSIYHAMFGPNQQVNPNIAHVNAILKVCARADDWDSMWDIVQKLPERGPLAPDAWTWSTLFNYMSRQIDPSASGNVEAHKRQQTIIKARQFWSVIAIRWKAADLQVDENAMASMGRVLLASTEARDWDDVFSLINQATEIPRLMPKIGFEAVEAVGAPARTSLGADLVKNSKRDERSNEFAPILDEPEILPVGDRRPQPRGWAGYTKLVVPGPLTLATVLQACLNLKTKQGAWQYWTLLTDPKGKYAISPDHGCVHIYMRILRIFRSSAESTELVCQQMPNWGLTPSATTLKIAIRVCLRDERNPQVIDSAARILKLMHDSLPNPDLDIMHIYVQLLNIHHARTDSWSVLKRGIDGLGNTVHNLRSWLNFGPIRSFPQRRGDDERSTRTRPDDKIIAVDLMQRIVGLYDRLLASDQETFPNRQLYAEEKARLTAFIARFKDKWKLHPRERVSAEPPVSRARPSWEQVLQDRAAAAAKEKAEYLERYQFVWGPDSYPPEHEEEDKIARSEVGSEGGGREQRPAWESGVARRRLGGVGHSDGQRRGDAGSRSGQRRASNSSW